jgi:hypothetical protein
MLPAEKKNVGEFMNRWSGFVAAGLLLGLSIPAGAQDTAQLAGAWHEPSTPCTAATFTATEHADTRRGEAAIRGVMKHSGKTIPGLLIVTGARRGQMVSPDTDLAVFLFDMPGGKLRMIPMSDSLPGVKEVVMDLCPGTKPPQ